MMNIGSEKTILLYNPLIYDTSDIISSYTYRKGILDANYGFSAAVGLFNSVINFVLLLRQHDQPTPQRDQSVLGELPWRFANLPPSASLMSSTSPVVVSLVLITLYPVLYVLFASFSSPSALAQHRGLLFAPKGFSLSAFEAVFNNPNIMNGYRNTLFYMVAGTALNMVMTCLGAYALSRKNLMWKTPITLMIVFTLFFSGGLVPTYLLVARSLDWIDTPLGVDRAGCHQHI